MMRLFFLLCLITNICLIGLYAKDKQKSGNKEFTDIFMTDSCTFETMGRNPYFILEPGYQLILQGIEGKNTTRLIITVLNETKKIGSIETRIVEEKESVNGTIVEISRNYFAYCRQNGSIFYFGEDVDNYKNGKLKNHEGSWTALGNNKAGIAMPGIILLGARYYQEMAPGIAMDRAEIIGNEKAIKTEAGEFSGCLITEETTALNPEEKEYKFYAPGIGLIKDQDLLLVKYGFAE